MNKIYLSVLAAFAAFSVSAKTVAWWPPAGENGVRTTVDDVFPNVADTASASSTPMRPLSMKNAVIQYGNDTCPVGTNFMTSGLCVYDPSGATNVAASTGLYSTSCTSAPSTASCARAIRRRSN